MTRVDSIPAIPQVYRVTIRSRGWYGSLHVAAMSRDDARRIDTAEAARTFVLGPGDFYECGIHAVSLACDADVAADSDDVWTTAAAREALGTDREELPPRRVLEMIDAIARRYVIDDRTTPLSLTYADGRIERVERVVSEVSP